MLLLLLLLRLNEQVVAIDTDRFWQLVDVCLREMFDVNVGAGARLRREVTLRPAAEQLLFYHAEPLDVAAQLAGITPSESQVKEYVARRSTIYRE